MMAVREMGSVRKPTADGAGADVRGVTTSLHRSRVDSPVLLFT
jgi:hypothetical protein